MFSPRTSSDLLQELMLDQNPGSP